MKKNIKNKKGFTLIELIVVIGILAVLAMILVPTVSGYMTKSKLSVAQANTRSCYSAYAATYTMLDSNLLTDSEKTDLAEVAKGLGAPTGCTASREGTPAIITVTYQGITFNGTGFGGTYSGS